jgi:hypothetical protein
VAAVSSVVAVADVHGGLLVGVEVSLFCSLWVVDCECLLVVVGCGKCVEFWGEVS